MAVFTSARSRRSPGSPSTASPTSSKSFGGPGAADRPARTLPLTHGSRHTHSTHHVRHARTSPSQTSLCTAALPAVLLLANPAARNHLSIYPLPHPLPLFVLGSYLTYFNGVDDYKLVCVALRYVNEYQTPFCLPHPFSHFPAAPFFQSRFSCWLPWFPCSTSACSNRRTHAHASHPRRRT